MPQRPQPVPSNSPRPLSDDEVGQLGALLDAASAHRPAMDTSMLDGYLVGVLLQPRRIAVRRWLPLVLDPEGQAASAAAPVADSVQALVLRRHAQLDAAIDGRAWFDPWVYAPDTPDTPDALVEAGDTDAVDAAVFPWVAGFAAAMSAFPALMDHPSTDLTAPLAMVLRHLDRDDLEEADALLAEIDALEPMADVDDAIEDLVRATLRIADVTRPRGGAPRS